MTLLTSTPSHFHLHLLGPRGFLFSFPWKTYLVWDLGQGPTGSAHRLHRVWSGDSASSLAPRCEVTAGRGSMKAPFHGRPRETSKHLRPRRQKKKKKSPGSTAHFTSLERWRLEFVCLQISACSWRGLAAKTLFLSLFIQLNLFPFCCQDWLGGKKNQIHLPSPIFTEAVRVCAELLWDQLLGANFRKKPRRNADVTMKTTARTENKLYFYPGLTSSSLRAKWFQPPSRRFLLTQEAGRRPTWLTERPCDHH